MKEVVLGLGHQKSLWSVVQMADEQPENPAGNPDDARFSADQNEDACAGCPQGPQNRDLA